MAPRSMISIHAPLAGRDGKHAQIMRMICDNLNKKEEPNRRRGGVCRKADGMVGRKTPCWWCELRGKCPGTSASHLHDQRILRKIGLLAAEVLDLTLVLLAEVVKPQAVPFRVHDGAQLRL